MYVLKIITTIKVQIENEITEMQLDTCTAIYAISSGATIVKNYRRL